ncbi:[protein-PII] uridylyltransferase [Opitutales bacterium ASA1]|uniref:[protein-PII] uridylyltransferase n=1 Tax=Congregicoccus parvus TaxID=3081749 RepID=UPI002B2C8ED1|nr:[protein-PII] uridylyltransferase [Opitutales bacterium ASA1]
MSSRTATHARQKLAFTAEDSLAKRLAACKRFLRLESEMIRMRHRGGESGLRIAQARSNVVDVLLQRLIAPALQQLANGDRDPAATLVALGGYGRAELCPLSDIDIMFLFPDSVKEARLKEMQQKLTDEVLYTLWDLGLKIGHSFRTISDTLTEARSDIQTKTSLLEARYLAGSENTYRTFAQAYRNFFLKENPKGYISARLEDQASRRKKFGDTVFLQEPDIKNGVGGLRDFQNAIWMARVKLGITTADELVEMAYLKPGELRDFRQAYNFLLRVRNQLHFESKKPTDALNLEKQPRIARALGYDQRDLLERVEAFMRDYYRAAQTIYRISRLLEHRLALATENPEKTKVSFKEVIRARRHDRSKRLDGFILRGRELAAENDDVFQDDPIRLVRVFRHAQQLNAQLDFELGNLIRENLPKLTRKVVQSHDANRSFRAILNDIGRVYPALRAMHEHGVLGRFVPEWDGLTCLVQHEYYHRYTADVHTLNTILELDRVFTDPEKIYSRYRFELRETSLPELLYTVLLLHDVGKGDGIENHAEVGVRIAEPVLGRLGYDEPQREVIRFLVKNHLTMARFWQKFDLDDPKTTAAFAEIVGDAERLRYLYVHTFCDARATAATLWNGYKDTLHTTLFRNTAEHIEHGGAVARQEAKRFEMTKKDLLSRKIPEVSEEEVNAHFSLLPERYFIYTENDEIALHLQMVNRLLKTIIATDAVGSLKPIIEWRDDLERSLTVVNIVTWDRAGLFYKLAGAFSLAGLNIHTAKIISRSDHIAIDTFYVAEPGRGVVQNQKVMDQFQKNVHQALISNKDLYPEIVVQARKSQSKLFSGDENPLLASFTPSVDVYHELSLQRTIVEVQTPDQIGLLYQVSKAIYDHGFDITFARINTERGLAIDTFYIENADKDAVAEVGRLEDLRDTIGRIIAPEQKQVVHF